MSESSLPLSNNAHLGIQNVLRAHYGPDTQVGIKDRKVTNILEVPAIMALKMQKVPQFPHLLNEGAGSSSSKGPFDFKVLQLYNRS